MIIIIIVAMVGDTKANITIQIIAITVEKVARVETIAIVKISKMTTWILTVGVAAKIIIALITITYG